MGVTRSELINILKKSFIDKTNKKGYIDMNKKIATLILEDLEQYLTLEYKEEVSPEQLSFNI